MGQKDIFGGERSEGSDSNAVDVLRGVQSSLLHDTILAAVRKGWLISFGRSRDGYTASVAVLDSGAVSRGWASDTSALEALLERAMTAATDVDQAPAGLEGKQGKQGRR